MKIFEEIGRVAFGDMTAMFFREKGKVCFTLVPAGMEEEIPEHCKLLNDTVGCRGYTLSGDRDTLAIQPESAVQFKIAGDAYWDNFSAGRTMRNSGSVDQLRFDGLRQEEGKAVLLFHDGRGLQLEQTMRQLPGRPWIEINTTLTNSGSEAVTVEMLSSFSLGLLSPFQPDDGVECYRNHRWSSNWSAEGRHEPRSVEELGIYLVQGLPAQVVIAVARCGGKAGGIDPVFLHRPQHLGLIVFRNLVNGGEAVFQLLQRPLAIVIYRRGDPHGFVKLQ